MSERLRQITRLLALDHGRMEQIYRDIDEGRRFGAVYFSMLVSSCLIALLGLLTNSTAVIIGAMLISPLMGPILACGLALTIADWHIGKKSLKNIGLSVVEVVAISAVATTLSPLKEPTAEILARTSPNLMDLLIAFFSGVAGTLALTMGRAGMTIIPGVAIATAVMPPLAVTGYGIGTAQWGVANGGFMLFFTNLVAIVISSEVVFLLAGYRPRFQVPEHEHHFLVRNRMLLSAAILLLVSVPLIYTLSDAVQQVRLRRGIRTVLRDRVEIPRQSELASFDFQAGKSPLPINVLVRTVQPIDDQTVQDLSQTLESTLGAKVDLQLHQLLVERGGVKETREVLQARWDLLRKGTAGIRELVQLEMSKMPLTDFEQRVVQPVERAAREAVGLLPQAELLATRVGLGPTFDPLAITCSIASEGTLNEQNRVVLESFLGRTLNRAVRLEVLNFPESQGYSKTVNFPADKAELSVTDRRRISEYIRDLQQMPNPIQLWARFATTSVDRQLWQQRRAYLSRLVLPLTLYEVPRVFHPGSQPTEEDDPNAVQLIVVQALTGEE